jgi:predicted AAA+ superfamily ATPase
MHYERLLKAPSRSFFLFGARGTGKSTWARARFPDAHVFDLRDEGLYQELVRAPQRFADLLRRVPRGRWVVLDEVQRLPALLNEVHRALDEKKHRFVLLGSSARKLRRAGQNLLGGRASALTLLPFAPSELGDDFDLEQAMTSGLLPVVWTDEAREEALLAYAQAYLRDEVQGEALVRNLPAFSRFLEVAALMHGQVLNASTLARDAGVMRTTVMSYLDLLEDTLLALRLPAFEAKLRVRERAHPKFFFIDGGIVRGLKRQVGPLTHEERGPLFEGLVLHAVRAELLGRRLEAQVSYWGAPGAEVDLVVSAAGRHWAIDVTSSPRLHDGDSRGLRAITPLPGLTRRTLVYAGSRAAETADGIEVLPFGEFATTLGAGLEALARASSPRRKG